MSESVTAESNPDVKNAVEAVLGHIDREREREIISRRFGLYDRKETLEQIGELLGITRERVRQLEKAILIRLKIAAEEGQKDVAEIEKVLVRHLSEMGNAARLSDLASALVPGADDRLKAQVGFIAELAPRLTTLDEKRPVPPRYCPKRQLLGGEKTPKSRRRHGQNHQRVRQRHRP